MIARVHFNGIVTEDGKELEYADYCDIHVAKLSDAEKTFKFWLEKGFSVRGGRGGVWHLNGQYGKMEFVRVEKRTKEKT